MALNIIEAHFCEDQVRTWTDELWQYDYGQVLVFDGLNLPVAYEVHFANAPHGVNSTTQIGDAGGVQIPDAYLQTGECVYAWVYLHDGETDGETEYMVTIPVTKRAKPTNATPTPVQQDVITETIAALQEAVERSDTNVTHYPKIEGDYWYIWDATEEEWTNTGIKALGEDGTSTTVSVSSIIGGHRVKITDAEGDHVFDVMDGQPGANGNGIVSIEKTGTTGLIDTYTITFTNGTSTTFTVTNGLDGVSPEVNVQVISGGHRVIVTDEGGTESFDVMDGEDGDPGFSPTISVVDITGGHRITITDKTGDHVVDVMDGEQGDPGPGVPTGGTTGQVLRKQSNADFNSKWDRETVTDVQINGSTVLDQNGVANIPYAATGIAGVGKIKTGYGINLDSVDKAYAIIPASSNNIKAGSYTYYPITTIRQHESVFYGLTKAAGADMSSSSNAVGTYTENAKSAISAMLNAPESKTGTTVSITAKDGIRYKCGEVATLDIVVPASGLFEVDFESGSTATVLTTTGATVTWPSWFDPTDLEADTLYEISIQDGKGLVATWPA